MSSHSIPWVCVSHLPFLDWKARRPYLVRMEFQKAEFLEEGEVVALVGLDANAIARLGQAFPVPVVVRGERYWSRAEVEAWLVYGTSDC